MRSGLWFVLLLASGCTYGVDLDGEPESQLECIEHAEPDHVPDSVPTVALQVGSRTVEWYEAESAHGSVFGLSEVGPGFGIPLLRQYDGIQRLRPVEQWQLLTNADIPSELVEYEQRWLESVGSPTDHSDGSCEGVGAEGETIEPASEPRDGSCSASWFDTTWCDNQADHMWCVLNHWHGAWVAYDNESNLNTAVCADIGTVIMRVKVDGDVAFNYTVGPGQVRVFYHYGHTIFDQFDYRLDVLNATDNRFHFQWASDE